MPGPTYCTYYHLPLTTYYLLLTTHLDEELVPLSARKGHAHQEAALTGRVEGAHLVRGRVRVRVRVRVKLAPVARIPAPCAMRVSSLPRTRPRPRSPRPVPAAAPCAPARTARGPPTSARPAYGAAARLACGAAARAAAAGGGGSCARPLPRSERTGSPPLWRQGRGGGRQRGLGAPPARRRRSRRGWRGRARR
eukprot:scaffold59439_cov44-Phaeocystis_antarctica.AAC.1